MTVLLTIELYICNLTSFNNDNNNNNNNNNNKDNKNNNNNNLFGVVVNTCECHLRSRVDSRFYCRTVSGSAAWAARHEN